MLSKVRMAVDLRPDDIGERLGWVRRQRQQPREMAATSVAIVSAIGSTPVCSEFGVRFTYVTVLLSPVLAEGSTE